MYFNKDYKRKKYVSTIQTQDSPIRMFLTGRFLLRTGIGTTYSYTPICSQLSRDLIQVIKTTTVVTSSFNLSIQWSSVQLIYSNPWATKFAWLKFDLNPVKSASHWFRWLVGWSAAAVGFPSWILFPSVLNIPGYQSEWKREKIKKYKEDAAAISPGSFPRRHTKPDQLVLQMRKLKKYLWHLWQTYIVV